MNCAVNTVTDMDTFSMLFGLLDSTEEALEHCQLQLTELRLEEFGLLFKDAIISIGVISQVAVLYVTEDSLADLVGQTAQLRVALQQVIDAYERGSIAVLQQLFTQSLRPALAVWRRLLEAGMISPVLS